MEQQHRLIGELNERFAREEAAGEAPEGAHPDGFRLLHGCEMEIRVDGRLDYDDALLARFDVVVASLHVGRRQPRAQLMARYETALRNPHVDIIAHPSGRKIDLRPDLDLDWDRFYAPGGRDRHAARGQRLGRAARPRRSPGACSARRRMPVHHRLRRPLHVRVGQRHLGHRHRQAGAAGWRHATSPTPCRATAFLALMAEKPHRV